MSDEPLLIVRREGQIAVVTMNNPARRNPFSQLMREALRDAFAALVEDGGVRAVVLTGAGGAFCGGADIAEMKARPVIEGRFRVQIAADIIRLIAMGPKPVVGAVEGPAFGAGLALTAACDYGVAAANSRFSCAFVRIGLVPDTGAFWLLPRRVGPAKAWELMSLGTEIDGAEALRIGLVNQVVEPGAALAGAMAVAEKYAALPPVALAMMKRAASTASVSLDATTQAEMDLQPLAMRTRDHQEAAKAFLEKRKPDFTGE